MYIIYGEGKFYLAGLEEGTTTVCVRDDFVTSNEVTVNVIKRDLEVKLNDKKVQIDTSKEFYADLSFEINNLLESDNIGVKVENERIANCTLNTKESSTIRALPF